jgi:hypothetical protein
MLNLKFIAFQHSMMPIRHHKGQNGIFQPHIHADSVYTFLTDLKFVSSDSDRDTVAAVRISRIYRNYFAILKSSDFRTRSSNSPLFTAYRAPLRKMERMAFHSTKKGMENLAL